MAEFKKQQSQNQASSMVRPAKPDRETTRPLNDKKYAVHQQVLGNQAVQRLLKSKMVQAKLEISDPNDKYEQEADKVADQVMRMPEPKVQCQPEEEKEEEELIQTKPVADQITPLIQKQVEPEDEEEEILQNKKANNQTPEVTSNIESRIHALKGSGQPLPENVRNYFEPRFGTDFSQVRVHTDSNAVEANQVLKSNAFTVGRDVVFGAGKYMPGTTTGHLLLSHELTHVLQQKEHQVNDSWSGRHISQSGKFEDLKADGEVNLISNDKPVSLTEELSCSLVQCDNNSKQVPKITISAGEPLIASKDVADNWNNAWKPKVMEWVRTRMIAQCLWARDGAKKAFEIIWKKFTPLEEDLIWDGFSVTVFLQPLQEIPIVGSYIRRTLTKGLQAGLAIKKAKLSNFKNQLLDEVYKNVNERFLIPSEPEYKSLLMPILLEAQKKFYANCEEGIFSPGDMQHTKSLKTLVEKKIPDVKGLTEFYTNVILEEMGPRILQGVVHAQIVIEDDEVAKKFKKEILERSIEEWDEDIILQLAKDILHTDWTGNKLLLQKYLIAIKPFVDLQKRQKDAEKTTIGPPK